MRTITIDGRLGKDAELKSTASGAKYVRFSVANTSYVEGKDETVWFDITSFDTQVIERQLDYLKKGKVVYVTGTLNVKLNHDSSGKSYINHYIRANNIEFCKFGGKSEGEPEGIKSQATFSTKASEITQTYGTQTSPQPSPAVSAVQISTSGPYVATINTSSDDDELPF